MKTLLFTLEYPPQIGGVSNYYVNLLKYWPDNRNISVLDNSNSQLVNPKWRWLPSIKALRQRVKADKTNHVIVGHVLPLGTAAWLILNPKKITYTIVLHGMDFPFALKTWRKRFITKKILNKASSIICSNQHTADLAKTVVKDTSKIAVVNPGVDVVPYPSSLAVEQLRDQYNLHGKTLLFGLGRLVKRKGFDQTIGAFSFALNNNPNMVLAIAGTGPEEETLKKIISMLPVEQQQKIIMLGTLTEDEKWTWLEACNIFIMPPREIAGDFEGFGIVYLEANLMNKPVIAGRAGGVPDAVVDGLNGLLVDGTDLDAIAEAITKLSLDPELANALGRQGRERALRDFNWSDKIKDFYEIATKL